MRSSSSRQESLLRQDVRDDRLPWTVIMQIMLLTL
jgi:hypothetical protein